MFYLKRSINGENNMGLDLTLEEDEKNKHIVGTPGGPQKCIVINELGVYSLAFVSRKAIAKRFKKWVEGLLGQQYCQSI